MKKSGSNSSVKKLQKGYSVIKWQKLLQHPLPLRTHLWDEIISHTESHLHSPSHKAIPSEDVRCVRMEASTKLGKLKQSILLLQEVWCGSLFWGDVLKRIIQRQTTGSKMEHTWTWNTIQLKIYVHVWKIHCMCSCICVCVYLNTTAKWAS
jgi:hypothetical protein